MKISPFLLRIKNVKEPLRCVSAHTSRTHPVSGLSSGCRCRSGDTWRCPRAAPAHPPGLGPAPHAPAAEGTAAALPRRPQVTPAPAAPRAAAELPGSQKVPERLQQELRDGGGGGAALRRSRGPSRGSGAEQPWAAARRGAEPPPPPSAPRPALPLRLCRAGRLSLGAPGPPPGPAMWPWTAGSSECCVRGAALGLWGAAGRAEPTPAADRRRAGPVAAPVRRARRAAGGDGRRGSPPGGSVRGAGRVRRGRWVTAGRAGGRRRGRSRGEAGPAVRGERRRPPTRPVAAERRRRRRRPQPRRPLPRPTPPPGPAAAPASPVRSGAGDALGSRRPGRAEAPAPVGLCPVNGACAGVAARSRGCRAQQSCPQCPCPPRAEAVTDTSLGGHRIVSREEALQIIPSSSLAKPGSCRAGDTGTLPGGFGTSPGEDSTTVLGQSVHCSAALSV